MVRDDCPGLRRRSEANICYFTHEQCQIKNYEACDTYRDNIAPVVRSMEPPNYVKKFMKERTK